MVNMRNRDLIEEVFTAVINFTENLLTIYLCWI